MSGTISQSTLLKSSQNNKHILFDPYQNKILFVEQFRPTSMKKFGWTLETVSGTVESFTYNNICSVVKEVKEESNVLCLDIFYILNYFNSSGTSSELTHLYLGIFNSKGNNKISGLTSKSEEIKTHLYDLNTSLFLVKKGLINHPSSIISLFWLKSKYYDILK